MNIHEAEPREIKGLNTKKSSKARLLAHLLDGVATFVDFYFKPSLIFCSTGSRRFGQHVPSARAALARGIRT